MPTAYVVAPNSVAPDISRRLVEERLAAGVNRVSCDSVYRWDGDVVDDSEAILFVEAPPEEYDALEARIVELHPYEVPCVVRLDEAESLPAFADWRTAAVGKPDE